MVRVALLECSGAITASTLSGNQAGESSGGLLLQGGTAYIAHSELSFNRYSIINLQNCSLCFVLMAECRAETYGGGMSVINVQSSLFAVVSIIDNNVKNLDKTHSELHGAGGGLYLQGGEVVVRY